MDELTQNIRFTRADRLKIQRLYLVKDYKPAEIAAETGFTQRQIYELCYRQGWSKLKKKQEQRIAKTAESEVDSIIAEDQEFRNLVRLESQELVEKAMNRAKNAEDGKDMSGYASSAKTFFDMYERSSGTGGQAQDGKSVNNTLNILYIQPLEPGNAKDVDNQVIDV